jgi:hypothetical protein
MSICLRCTEFLTFQSKDSSEEFRMHGGFEDDIILIYIL